MGDYGSLITAAREAANLTQEQLGKKVGLTGVSIMRYEKNQREPTQKKLRLLANALNVSVAYLEGYESMEVRAIMEAIERKDMSEFERLLGLEKGSIKEIETELKVEESLITTYARTFMEAEVKDRLLRAFDSLNPDGQQKVISFSEDLAGNPKYRRQVSPDEDTIPSAKPPHEMSDAELHVELDRQLAEEKNQAENPSAYGRGKSGTATG